MKFFLKLLSFCLFLSYKSGAQKPLLHTVIAAYNLDKPTDIVATADGRVFITLLNGQVKVFKDGYIYQTPLIDISSKCSNTGWNGIYGIALHPNFEQNGFVFLHYEEKNTQNSVYARYQINPQNINELDINSEQIIIKIPYTNPGHFGGHFNFGPDGNLYIANGDGATGARNVIGDPNGNAQNNNSFFGKLIRINVDNGLPYTIPIDNPFLTENDGILDEIWASGLRNPWAWSFDSTTGDIYIGDVGHDDYDELNKVPAQSAGLNFGWPCRQGLHAYSTQLCNPNTSFFDPILEFEGYTFNNIGFSITGGFMYRQGIFKSLNDWYLYGDYTSGAIYTLRQMGDGSYKNVMQNIQIPGILAFAKHPDGIYALNFTEGRLYYVYVNRIKSNRSGSWDDVNTWDCNCVPSNGDEVTINTNHIIDLNHNATVGWMENKGKINLVNNAVMQVGE